MNIRVLNVSRDRLTAVGYFAGRTEGWVSQYGARTMLKNKSPVQVDFYLIRAKERAREEMRAIQRLHDALNGRGLA